MTTLEGDHLELGLKMKMMKMMMKTNKARWGHTSVAGRALDEQMEAEKSACLGTRRSQKGECTPDSGLSGYRVIGLSGYRCVAAGVRQRTTDCERYGSAATGLIPSALSP